MDKLKSMKREGKEIAARAKNPANKREGKLIAAQAEHELGEVARGEWVRAPKKGSAAKKKGR